MESTAKGGGVSGASLRGRRGSKDAVGGGGGSSGASSVDGGVGSSTSIRGRSTDGCLLLAPSSDDLPGLGLGLNMTRRSGGSPGGADHLLGTSAPASSPKWRPAPQQLLPLTSLESPASSGSMVMPVIGFHPPAIAANASAAAALFSSSLPSSPVSSPKGRMRVGGGGGGGVTNPLDHAMGASALPSGHASPLGAAVSNRSLEQAENQNSGSSFLLNSAPAALRLVAPPRDDSLSNFMRSQH